MYLIYNDGQKFDYVITVCDEANASRCPIFPGAHKKINWSFDDPSSFKGNEKEKLQLTISVRDKIKEAVLNLIEELNS